MEKENFEKEFSGGVGIDRVRKFKELFDFINSQKLDGEYRDAYDYAVSAAKGLIETKSKDFWSAQEFEDDVASKYPNISEEFKSALRRCIENYNPPVNLPGEPLWE